MFGHPGAEVKLEHGGFSSSKCVHRQLCTVSGLLEQAGDSLRGSVGKQDI